MKRLALALTITLAISRLTPCFAGPSDGRLDIYWIDVEGGASTLIVTPRGESVLIDTGNPGRRDADRIFQTAVKTAGIEQIDHLIITHYHGDHFGGAATLSAILPIRKVYDNGIFEGLRDRPSKEYLEFKADARIVLNPGDEIALEQPTDKGVKLSLKCLGGRQKFVPVSASQTQANDCCADAQSKPIDLSDNANSIVTLLEFGPFRFFDAGDLTWNMEKELVCPVNRVGKVDVYQVTHHGLDSSNNPVLIRSLEPRVAVMNNGTTKGCEPTTFQALKSQASVEAIYQVHRNLRADSVNNTADELIANAEQECQGNIIQLSVDPSGRTYTMRIPAKGHERTFKTR
jgi:beta-lactamase superfamily II metal-dependent hydrolase